MLSTAHSTCYINISKKFVSSCLETSGGGEQPEEGAQGQKRRFLSEQDQESDHKEHFFLCSERYSSFTQSACLKETFSGHMKCILCLQVKFLDCWAPTEQEKAL